MMQGYRELDHTADWALEIWAPDMAGLVAQAIEGMRTLMGITTYPASAERVIERTAPDNETLLVDVLSEILLANEADRVYYEPMEIRAEGFSITARCRVLPVESQEKEIKAVTYHGLEVRETERGLEAVVVFDV